MKLLAFLEKISTRNKAIVGLAIFYLILQLQDFSWALGHEFLYLLLKFSVGLTIFILLLRADVSGEQKVLLVIGYFALLYGIGKLDLWTFSAKAYIHHHQSVFDKAVTLLSRKKDKYIFVNKGLIIEGKKFRLSTVEKQTLLDLFDNTDVIEIDVKNRNILFTFDRFIDNGYGLLWVNNPGPSTSPRFQIPYDITGKVSLEGNWYYVAFT